MGKLTSKGMDWVRSVGDRLGIAKKRTSPRKGGATRRVSFGAVKVTEFERLLCGGGGVPDGDVVSLGLGRPVRSYETVARDRPRSADKDTYCMRGCLDVRRRAELLCKWMRKKEYLALLRKLVKPQLLRVQRNREASNAVPSHCRDMPATIEEAQSVARHDEAVARRLQQQLAPAAVGGWPGRAGGGAEGGLGGEPDEGDDDASGACEPDEEEEGEGAQPAAPLGGGAQLAARGKRSGRPIRSPKRLRTLPGDAGADGELGGEEGDGEEEEAAAEEADADSAHAHKRAARTAAGGGADGGASGAGEEPPARAAGEAAGPRCAAEPQQAACGGARPARGALGDISRWLVWRDF